MSGVNHSIDASSSRGERPISASLSVRAVWGILWGAEPTGSKISTESVLYNKNWWRGLDSNQRRRSQRIYSPSPLATRAPLRPPAGIETPGEQNRPARPKAG